MEIKKYNQFVKTNEEFRDAPSLDTEQTPSNPGRGTETMPGRPVTTPSTRPSRPSVVPGKRPSEEDAPLASNDEYIGTIKMKELLRELGPSAKFKDNTIYYDNKDISFYSETEMFHVGKEKFADVKSVIDFLNNDKLTDTNLDPEFEAKSYRYSRNKRLK